MINFFKRIWEWLTNIPYDKLLHEKYGALVALFTFAVLYRFCVLWVCFLVADLSAIFTLWCKEAYDYFHPESHSAEISDVLWGMIGIAVVNAALLIMLL